MATMIGPWDVLPAETNTRWTQVAEPARSPTMATKIGSWYIQPPGTNTRWTPVAQPASRDSYSPWIPENNDPTWAAEYVNQVAQDPNWQPSSQISSSTSEDNSLWEIFGHNFAESNRADELPWYKYNPTTGPAEDPAIEKMREKIRQQQRDETSQPRILKRSTESSGDLPESHISDDSAHKDLTDSERRIGEASREELDLLSLFFDDQAKTFERRLESRQMGDVATSSAQPALKRKADSSPSAYKKRKTVADDLIPTALSTSHQDPRDKELDQLIEMSLANNAGVLARNIGHEVRGRAKTSSKTKTKRTAASRFQPTEPSKEANIAEEGFKGAKVVDATSKTASRPLKKPAGTILRNPAVVIYRDPKVADATPKTVSRPLKESAGTVLRNPAVVIYRDPTSHKQDTAQLSGKDALGDSTVLNQGRANGSLPRIQKDKKPRTKNGYRPAPDNKGRVSKTSKPTQKPSSKNTKGKSRMMHPLWASSLDELEDPLNSPVAYPPWTSSSEDSDQLNTKAVPWNENSTTAAEDTVQNFSNFLSPYPRWINSPEDPDQVNTENMPWNENSTPEDDAIQNSSSFLGVTSSWMSLPEDPNQTNLQDMPWTANSTPAADDSPKYVLNSPAIYPRWTSTPAADDSPEYVHKSLAISPRWSSSQEFPGHTDTVDIAWDVFSIPFAGPSAIPEGHVLEPEETFEYSSLFG